MIGISPGEGREAPPAMVATPDGKPPSDAVVIFDGQNTDALVSRDGKACRWPIVDGALVAQHDGGLWTKLRFRDAQVHAEFATPKQGEGNSGLYFHGLFEMQIFNSYGSKKVDTHSAGALYGIAAPLVNAARPPGEWQTYDVIYNGPRRDSTGKVTRPGTITALLNGVLVQNQVEFREHVSPYTPLLRRPNPYVTEIRAELMKTDIGPLHLQDHEERVRFRNIWIRRLDDGK
ncbi:MAG: DUF1080 domain-containing protein [Planctomycetes bacterium]|nr:DUF1080 domain-containing protein [Planctomycetota bacterium]